MPFKQGNLLGFIKGHKRQNGVKNSRWKGGRILRAGYWKLYLPNHPLAKNNYYFEHRYIVEQKIGRVLKSFEVVHHINHDKQDNRPENLMLLSSNTEHMAIHARDRAAGKLQDQVRKGTK